MWLENDEWKEKTDAKKFSISCGLEPLDKGNLPGEILVMVGLVVVRPCFAGPFPFYYGQV